MSSTNSTPQSTDLTNETRSALERVISVIRKYDSAIVAFSGGIDSTLLLRIAREVLKDKVLAVTITSPLHTRAEGEEARAWLESQKIEHVFLELNPLSIAEVSQNSQQRCYHCKKALFSAIKELAATKGIEAVFEGSNLTDAQSYRPGAVALRELKIISPLYEGKMTKSQIREAARDIYTIPSWNKPASGCLATRFPYGSTLTADRLSHVATLEQYLFDHGFTELRARIHDTVVRLEFGAADLERFMNTSDCREEFVALCKSLGFGFVTVDIEGLRSGCYDS